MKNLEDVLEGNFFGYFYGEILLDKVYLIGCVVCRCFYLFIKIGYLVIFDWKNERLELFSFVLNGR